MQIGRHVPTHVARSVNLWCCLQVLPLLGELKSKIWFLFHLQKQSIDRWLEKQRKYDGYFNLLLILVFRLLPQFPSIVIVKLLFTLLLIRSFTKEQTHIERNCHFVRDTAKARLISLRHVSTKDQLADILTKALGRPQFHHLFSKLGVQNLYSPT